MNERATVERTFSKVVRIGRVPCGRNSADLFCKAEIKDGRLSITGVVGPNQTGNARGGYGQICMEFAHRNPADNDRRYREPIEPDQITFAPGWDKEKWLDFLDLWERWHLNDMKAGCEHQRKLGWKSYDEHPSEPCPVCGYKYGSAWLREELPESVVEFLQALPETDKQPAWV